MDVSVHVGPGPRQESWCRRDSEYQWQRPMWRMGGFLPGMKPRECPRGWTWKMLVERMACGRSSACDFPHLRPRYGYGVGATGRTLPTTTSSTVVLVVLVLYCIQVVPVAFTPQKYHVPASKWTAVGVARIYHAGVTQKISVSYIAGSIHSCATTCSH